MKKLCFAVLAMMMMACQPQPQTVQEEVNNEVNPVIENILTRRSVRKYQPQAVNRDTMSLVMKCGINAPNAINRQAWEVRVVDNPEILNGLTEIYKKQNPEMADREKDARNMFRDAPTVAFIAYDTTFSYAPVDCALLAENMMLSAWSMGIGSVCMGGPVPFLKSDAAAEIMKKLGFSENYELLLTIGFGYPAEAPAARPRDDSKARFVD